MAVRRCRVQQTGTRTFGLADFWRIVEHQGDRGYRAREEATSPGRPITKEPTSGPLSITVEPSSRRYRLLVGRATPEPFSRSSGPSCAEDGRDVVEFLSLHIRAAGLILPPAETTGVSDEATAPTYNAARQP